MCKRPNVFAVVLPFLACATTTSSDLTPDSGISTSTSTSTSTSVPDAAPQGPGAMDDVLTCDPWFRQAIAGTDGVLVNNLWNEQWAGGSPHSQCLLKRPKADGSMQYGWRWDWPAYKPYTSYAAPEVLVGWKAWDGGKSTLAGMPRRIDSLTSLKVDFAVQIAATTSPTYNLNTTMWVTETDAAPTLANPSDIRNEIMVWFANPAGLGGGITYDGDVTLAGIVFDVWHLVNNPDASGVSTQTWTMIIYAARGDRQAVAFDLKLVLDDCIAKGLVKATHAVGSVELITEIFGGKGELWLDHFGVTAK